MTAADWIGDRIARSAAARLAGRHPEWSAAMLAERDALEAPGARLAWSLGMLRASLTLGGWRMSYPLILVFALVAMALCEWSVDEGPLTLLALAGLGLSLGILHPRRCLISGLAVGAVVTVVKAFETLTGLLPAYPTHHHGLLHSLIWLALITPALAACLVGRRIYLKLAA